MNRKQTYTTPDVKIVHFQMEGAILIGSLTGTGTGADVIYEEESDFDSFFNN